MIIHSENISVWLVRKWVRLYTMGLPAEDKKTRRDEIDSDLWEQKQDAAGSGNGTGAAWNIFGRLLLGIPDDLSWRMENEKNVQRRESMDLANHLIRPSTYLNLIMVLVGMGILFPISVAAFVVAVVAAVVPPVLLGTIFIYDKGVVNFGPVAIDTFPAALFVSFIGLVLVLIEIFIANVIVSALRRFVSVRIGNLRIGQTP